MGICEDCGNIKILNLQIENKKMCFGCIAELLYAEMYKKGGERC